MRGLRFFITALFILVSTAAFGQADVDKVLKASRVDKALAFELTGTEVHYVIDGGPGGTLVDGFTFTSPGEIDLVYPAFNPFKVQISRTEAISDDPIAGAVARWIKSVVGFAEAVLPAPIATSAASEVVQGADEQTCDEVFRTCTTFASAQNEDASKREEALQSCEKDRVACECKKFKDEVIAAYNAVAKLNKAKIDKATLTGWIDRAVGRNGIITVRGEIEAAREQLANDIKAAKAAADTLSKLAAEKDKSGCTAIDRETVLKLFAISINLEDYIAAAQKLETSLTEIAAMLKPFESRRWRSDTGPQMDLVIGTAATDPKVIKTQTLTLQNVQYAPAPDGRSIVATKTAEQKRVFDVRRHRRLVPEAGLAMIYSELEYPKYTAVADTAGVLHIQKEIDDNNVEGAATLNFLCNCIGDDTIFPGIQVGVSTADDYPGLLLGLTLRLAGQRHIAIGAGAMVTWYKELNKLVENGVVTSQKQIDDDLRRRRSPAELYFAVQYNF